MIHQRSIVLRIRKTSYFNRKNTYKFFIILLALILPGGIENLDNLFARFIAGYFSAFTAACILAYYFFANSKKILSSKWCNIVLAFLIWQTISTLVNEGNMFLWIKYFIITYAICVFVINAMERDKNCFIFSVMLFSSLYILLEVFSQIGIVNIFGGKHFLTQYSQINMLFPVFGLSICLLNKNKKNVVLLGWFVFLALLIIFGSTVNPQIFDGTEDKEWTLYFNVIVVSMAVFIPWVFTKISGTVIVIGNIVINFSLVVSQQLLSIPFIQNILTNVLGKTSDMTGRTWFWQRGVLSVMESPMTGYGISWPGIYAYGNYYLPHNQFIQFSAQGGLVLLALYNIMLIYVCKKADCIKNVYMNGFLKGCLLAPLTTFLALSFSYVHLLPFFLLLTIIESSYTEIESY